MAAPTALPLDVLDRYAFKNMADAAREGIDKGIAETVPTKVLLEQTQDNRYVDFAYRFSVEAGVQTSSVLTARGQYLLKEFEHAKRATVYSNTSMMTKYVTVPETVLVTEGGQLSTAAREYVAPADPEPFSVAKQFEGVLWSEEDIHPSIQQFTDSAMHLIREQTTTNIAKVTNFFDFWRYGNKEFLSLLVRVAALLYLEAQFRQQTRPMLEMTYRTNMVQLARTVRHMNSFSISGEKIVHAGDYSAVSGASGYNM